MNIIYTIIVFNTTYLYQYTYNLPTLYFGFPLYTVINIFRYFALNKKSEMFKNCRYMNFELIFNYKLRTQFNLHNNICNRFQINNVHS